MELPNLEALNITEDPLAGLSNHLKCLNLREYCPTNITWDVILYADHSNDQFIFIAGPVANCYDIDSDYEWTRIGDLRLTFYYNGELTCAELLYTSFPEIDRWPRDFVNSANLLMLLPDFSLKNEGYMKVENYEEFIFDDTAGELNIFKDPLYGKTCKVPLIIIK